MIYTLTVNPSVDFHMDLSRSGFEAGKINRSLGEEMFPGGKGLNVSVVLAQLGIDSTAWGFAAGRCGGLLEALAEERGVRCRLIRLSEGETRINVKLDCEQETAINGNGPSIPPEAVSLLMENVRSLSSADTLVLSGNLQAGSENLYEAVCHEAFGRGARLAVDTGGEDLRRVLGSAPYLIKPNEDELLEMYGSSDHSEENIISLMRKCHLDGAQSVLATLGERGALYLSLEGELFRAAVVKPGPVVSTVGAGDSTVAGFLAGVSRFPGDYGRALHLACAAGTAAARCRWLASGAEIEAAAADIVVERIS